MSRAPRKSGRAGVRLNRAGAVRLLLERAEPPAAVSCAPEEALGLVLAEAASAECDVPEFAVSLRDGYALRAADIAGACPERPVRLPVGGRLTAESLPGMELPRGGAVRVLTGGPVPPGANVVVAEEHVSLEEGAVAFTACAPERGNVLGRGADLPSGMVLGGAGEEIDPGLAAVLVRARVRRVAVLPRPCCAVFGLGSELSDPYAGRAAAAVESGRMPGDNLVQMTGLLTRAGGRVVSRGVLPDDAGAIAAALAELFPGGAGPSLVLTSGGTGRSERDLARRAALRAGFELLFDGVEVRPGFGMFAAVRSVEGRASLLLGVPGPPGAVFGCLHAVLPPLLRALRGLAQEPPERVRLEAPLASRFDCEWLVPCMLRRAPDGLLATPLEQGSPLAALARARGVVAVPPGAALRAGDEAELLRFCS
ncbi:MAG: molybdopterin-binding protein [Desulfovibrionaceae bacterium]